MAATRDGGGFIAPGRMPPPRPSSAAGAGRPSRTAKPRRRSSLESSAPASATPARASAALEPARLRLALAAAVGLAMAAAAGLRRAMAAVAGLRPAIASAHRHGRRAARVEPRRAASAPVPLSARLRCSPRPRPLPAEQSRGARPRAGLRLRHDLDPSREVGWTGGGGAAWVPCGGARGRRGGREERGPSCRWSPPPRPRPNRAEEPRREQGLEQNRGAPPVRTGPLCCPQAKVPFGRAPTYRSRRPSTPAEARLAPRSPFAEA